MTINREVAMQIWESHYGNKLYARDFHGKLMYKYAYGNPKYTCDKTYGFCGWNIHHILPKARGGKTMKSNLACTNYTTNNAAADKTTYWIEGVKYQVRKHKSGYAIYEL